MRSYNFRNVEEALPEMLRAIERLGVERPSRNGPVRQFDQDVAIRYENPTERVLFFPERDANPFFHLAECLWMIAGRNDVEFPARFVKNFGQFSDNGKTFNGAYGYRWRFHFETSDGYPIDQIQTIVQALKKDPTGRRLLISMWDGHHDFGLNSKDIPCNLLAIPKIAPNGKLDLTVFNRSNDLIWGALGANAVHFSFLQEYLAGLIGVEVGAYTQVSTNMHAYTELGGMWDKCAPLIDLTTKMEPFRGRYSRGTVSALPIFYNNASTNDQVWREDIGMLIEEGPVVGIRIPWLRRVAIPMLMAHQHYSEGEGLDRYDGAIEIVSQCQSEDWKLAATEWLERRRQAAIDKGLA